MYKKRLIEIGVYPHLKGFEYLNQAIALFSYDKKIMKIYEEIALKNNSTVLRVERLLRYAVHTSRTDNDLCVSEFIAKYRALWGYNKNVCL